MWKIKASIFLRVRFEILKWSLFYIGAVIVAEKILPDYGFTSATMLVASCAGVTLWHRSKTFIQRVAIHEAAHAVISWKKPLLPEVNCVMAGKYEGLTSYSNEDMSFLSDDYETTMSYIVMLLAGIAAEIKIYGSPCAGTLSDFLKAECWAAEISRGSGLGRDEVLETAYRQVTNEVAGNWATIQALAQELEKRAVIDADGLLDILGPRPIS